MDAQAGMVQFREADALFRAGRYAEALVMLERLNRSFPDEKNLLYPTAVCLAKLGRGAEAVPLCDMLIQRYDLEKAKRLKHTLMETIRQQQTIAQHRAPLPPSLPTPPPLPGAADPIQPQMDYGLDLDAPVFQRTPAAEPETKGKRSRRWKRWNKIAVAVLLLLLLVAGAIAVLASRAGGLE